MKIPVLTLAATLTATAMAIPPKKAPIAYPQAPTEMAVDNYFGIRLADPFRPLEDDMSDATAKWVAEENAVTEDWLSKVPFREEFRQRLTELYDYRKEGMPWRGNDGKYYVFENSGLQNQSVLYRMNKPVGKKSVFLDPNRLSDDGTVALKGVFQSPSGKLTAYTVGRNGSDWTEIYVLDTRTGKLLSDRIEWAKSTEPSWNGDEGFYYSAYDRPADGRDYSSANMGHKVYYHAIGTEQEADRLIYEDPRHPLHFQHAWKPEKSPVLFVMTAGEGIGNAMKMKRLDSPIDQWITIEQTQDYEHRPIEVIGEKLYIITPWGAPKGRLMVADINNPERENWRELVPEARGVLKGAQFAGDRLLLTYEEDASDNVRIIDLEGNALGDFELPGLGTVALSSSREGGDEVFYRFTSFTDPGTVYRRDLSRTDRPDQLLSRPELKGVNPDDYVTEQVFFTSKDGTQVPMFLTYKRGLERTPLTPTYLYGYGGFNISLPPSFSPARMLWLEKGGVYAQVNLRGGAEYGEDWHLAGTRLQKQNVFDDFIAAAEYLIDRKQASPSSIVIEGGSNGGLLVGAVVNQRPDLYAVAIPRVGVMDMMRYHLFTIGWNWAADYGRSDENPTMAKYLLGYSPMHNIRNDGTPYPAILVTTADHDDRVVPAHSFKYAATLQDSNTGQRPKLIRIDSNAGHGAGKPTSKVIDEWTDIYSFIFKNLDL